MRVIVGGAGLAGLCAARDLAAAGATVTVVDARDRPGGRVWTMREGFAGGQYGELGGEFIDADQDAICGLTRDLGLSLVRVLRHGFTHRLRGDDGWFHVSRSGPWEALRESLAPLIRRYERAGGRDDAALVRELSTQSLDGWLREQGSTPGLHAAARSLRGFFLADPEDLSVLPLIEQLVKGGSPARARMYRVAGGNDRLVDALLQASAVRLLLQHRVRQIAQAGDRVSVDVEDDRGHAQQLDADAMVVAFPASTLRDVQITPPLPERQEHAIRQLAYGPATKVLLQTPGDVFGGRRARAFATDGSLGAFWDGSDPENTHAASLVTFLAGGSASAELRALIRGGGPEAVLSDLCWLPVPAGLHSVPAGLESKTRPTVRRPGPADPACLQSATWEDDAWARGGYAFIDAGFDPAWRPLLSRRAGRLVFAGEHTSDRWQGYMNGAVESGRRAARQLLADSD